MNVMVRELSLGERMKMELISALIHEPRVLFLDEPTIGLDVVSQKRVREFLRIYNEQHRIVTLLTSHYMQDIQELCDRVLIIDHGKIFSTVRSARLSIVFPATKFSASPLKSRPRVIFQTSAKSSSRRRSRCS